jgi:hypothetical protein
MELNEKCRLLAQELRKILGGKLIVSSDVNHYIYSTFSNPTTAELQTILNDDSNCEKDSLMELLLFPDESIQVQLESLLEDLQLQKQHKEMVLDHLMQEPLAVTIHFPAGRQYLDLVVPDYIADQFISRLKIFRHLDHRLIEAINQREDDNTGNRFKVIIRNSRFIPTANKIGFLCEFFKKMPAHGDEIIECLYFIVDFLDELKNDGDIYQALIAKKRKYFFSLQKAKQLNNQLQKNNIETLLLRGKRVVIIDQADIRQKMLIIDRICRAVFAKTEYFEPLHSDGGSLEFHSDQDIQEIISTLS